jgi:phage-related protein
MTRRVCTVILAAGMVIGLSAVSFAQQPTQTEIRNFDQYLDQHYDVRNDLTKNPSLVDDANYLAKHPHLKAFLEQHPNTRQQLKQNPSAFLKSESSLQKAQNANTPITQSELRNWDAYLDKHQDVKADLAKNPNLVNDPTYVAKHPHLRDYLENHPNTRQELRDNPAAFVSRENTYEKNETDQKPK